VLSEKVYTKPNRTVVAAYFKPLLRWYKHIYSKAICVVDKYLNTYIENSIIIFTLIFLCCFVTSLVIVYIATTSDLALFVALMAGILCAIAGTGTVVILDLLPKYFTYKKTGIFHLNAFISKTFKCQVEKNRLYDFIDDILTNNNNYKNISRHDLKITCRTKAPISTRKESVLNFIFHEINDGETILVISCSPESKKLLFDFGTSLKLIAAFIIQLRDSVDVKEAEPI
jgi:hypothetical protein